MSALRCDHGRTLDEPCDDCVCEHGVPIMADCDDCHEDEDDDDDDED